MLVEKLKTFFRASTPIFADEILELFPNYSKQYIYRLLQQAINAGELKCYQRGIYYLPEKAFFGFVRISADQVVEKKYVQKNKDIFGIYSGLSLLNAFGFTTQMPNTIEIVTNKEATRKRQVVISNRSFVVRKSRCRITRDNYAAYMILQLFVDMGEGDKFTASSLERLRCFVDKNNVSCDQLLDLSAYFPAKAVKRMMRSPIFHEVLSEQSGIRRSN